MFNKKVLAGVGSIVIGIAVFFGCGNKSTNPAPTANADIIGTWSGPVVTVVTNQGSPPDSYQVMTLTLKSTDSFYLERNKLVHASAQGLPDTSVLKGTWKVGTGDTVTLTPQSCAEYSMADGRIDSCACLPQFPSYSFVKSITNNVWKVPLMDWVNPDTIIYTLSKQ